ncbi:helix-turn-helix domain-containing protein [Shimia thalassica]|uniref:helix-turn-helix domain-containing protein n=1 Tax=Shimia thalassica TaxID=1715693 RepID=UPI0026E4207C|nr:helix-turn-helix domain-containing protein [Shimia thalassica]MDO6522948.1 helix-turn-helix domain-containing protein [Shimia thalassica]
MLTVSDVADRMYVSERTVFRWIKAGHLKAFRTGRVLRISEADLERFLHMYRTGRRATNLRAH